MRTGAALRLAAQLHSRARVPTPFQALHCLPVCSDPLRFASASRRCMGFQTVTRFEHALTPACREEAVADPRPPTNASSFQSLYPASKSAVSPPRLPARRTVIQPFPIPLGVNTAIPKLAVETAIVLGP